jgi:hypothetical protein
MTAEVHASSCSLFTVYRLYPFIISENRPVENDHKDVNGNLW